MHLINGLGQRKKPCPFSLQLEHLDNWLGLSPDLLTGLWFDVFLLLKGILSVTLRKESLLLIKY